MAAFCHRTFDTQFYCHSKTPNSKQKSVLFFMCWQHNNRIWLHFYCKHKFLTICTLTLRWVSFNPAIYWGVAENASDQVLLKTPLVSPSAVISTIFAQTLISDSMYNSMWLYRVLLPQNKFQSIKQEALRSLNRSPGSNFPFQGQ